MKRRQAREVAIGKAFIGAGHPIAVQSMVNHATRKVDDCVKQTRVLEQVGCEIVRFAVSSMPDVRAMEEIKSKLVARKCDIPLVADVHHNGSKIAAAVVSFVDKVRVNPGLFVFKKSEQGGAWTEKAFAEARAELEEQFLPVIEACKRANAAMRIGVNHGSLGERMTFTYGDTPVGMVESALELSKICVQQGFENIVLSFKASRVPLMVEAYELAAERFDREGLNFPFHLGVTEVGAGEYARIKSATGLGALLCRGIGDTIRVSLSEDPVQEIPVCYEVLQAVGARKSRTEFIACPSCGRTRFDLQRVLAEVEAATGHLPGLDIAVMGCIVNGPGEMADADYGYVGKGDDKVALYRGREEIKAGIPANQGVAELIKLIKADNRWTDPPRK